MRSNRFDTLYRMNTYSPSAMALICLALASALVCSGIIVARAGTVQDRTYTRRCENSVYGDLGRNWRKHSVIVGPIAFVGARDYQDVPAREFRRRDGGYRSQKILAVVDNGPNVVVRVGRYDRRHAGLVYDPRLFNRNLAIRESDREVTFDACADRQENPFGRARAQFNGGIVVAGRRCVTLKVRAPGGRLIGNATVSFGAGICGS